MSILDIDKSTKLLDDLSHERYKDVLFSLINNLETDSYIIQMFFIDLRDIKDGLVPIDKLTKVVFSLYSIPLPEKALFMQSPVSTILEYLQEIRRLIKLALPELYRRKRRVTDTKNNHTHF